MLPSMKQVALAMVAALVFAACGEKKPLSADEYYAEAQARMRDGAYPLAIESYRDLLDQHPFSEHSEEAELMIGEAQFHNDSCPEAIAAFSDFQRRHPTSPYLALVGYLIGACHERQMQIPTRDQSASQSAHAFYQAVVQQYPTSPFADLAEQRLAHCRENLADHEYSIAAYYRHRDNEAAERIRLIDLVRRFNDTDRAADALLRLGDLYRENGEDEKALLAYSALLYHHQDHNLAPTAEERIAALAGADHERVGDPLAALEALAGRSRNLEIVTRDLPESGGEGGTPAVGFNRPNRGLDPLGSGGAPRSGY